MINNVIESLPQILSIVILASGVVGKGFVRFQTIDAADHVGKAGTQKAKEAVHKISAALASGLISVTSYISNYFLLFVVFLSKLHKGLPSIEFLILAIFLFIFLLTFLYVILRYKVYQLSTKKVRYKIVFLDPGYLPFYPINILDITNLFMLVLIFFVSAL